MVALLSQTGILFDEGQAYLSIFTARFQLWIGFHEELRRLIDEFLEDLRCLSCMGERENWMHRLGQRSRISTVLQTGLNAFGQLR